MNTPEQDAGPIDWADRAEAFADKVLKPASAEVDRSSKIPQSHLAALAEQGFFGMLTSEGLTPASILDTAAAIIGGCLSTGFVWAQHLGATRAMLTTSNSALQAQYLPEMTTGQFQCGVSYAGARSNPTLFAEYVGDELRINGSAPFVTGWRHINGIVASLRVDDSVVTALLPVDELAGMTAQRLTLVAADASDTMRLTFTGTVISRDKILSTTPLDGVAPDGGALTDWINGALPLGVLRRTVTELHLAAGDEVAGPYLSQYDELRERFIAALGNAPATHAMRAEVAGAAVNAAAAFVVAAGSRSVGTGSTPEWMMRQGVFSLVCTTRDPIRAALLHQLRPD